MCTEEKKLQQGSQGKPDHANDAYEKPRLIELGKASKLTKYSSAGPFNDGSSEQGRNWKS